jgi:two-component system, NarL family, invasion response regulator UvrY
MNEPNYRTAVESGHVKSVLIIDDHPVVLQGCRRLLADRGVTSILEADNVVAGYELFCRHRPDVVIVDLAMGKNGLGGLSLIQRINLRDPQSHILVLSMHKDPIIVARALDAGASGYILKDAETKDLWNAIQAIQEGNLYLSHDLATQVALLSSSSRQSTLAELTSRELETLTLLAEGKSYGRIAEELNISYDTVANIGSRLKGKLEARNLSALVRKAVQLFSVAQ